MKTEKEYIDEYKQANPIYETSGTGTGTYKWIKYLDGIDLRYGHNTKRQAVFAIRKSAKQAYAMYVYGETNIICSHCKSIVKQKHTLEGRCINCFNER